MNEEGFSSLCSIALLYYLLPFDLPLTFAGACCLHNADNVRVDFGDRACILAFFMQTTHNKKLKNY